MSGAVDCLEFLPDELVVEVSRGLAACAEDLLQCKGLLYQVLVQHYGQTQQPPLLSNHVFDIHSGISELLGKSRLHHNFRLNSRLLELEMTPLPFLLKPLVTLFV